MIRCFPITKNFKECVFSPMANEYVVKLCCNAVLLIASMVLCSADKKTLLPREAIGASAAEELARVHGL